MPAPSVRPPRLDPRAPFVLDTRELGRRPGSMRRVTLTPPAPPGWGLELVGVPAGAAVTAELRLEAVMEGVLVSGTVSAPTAGECGRCLEPASGRVEAEICQLYAYDPEDVGADEDTALLAGDLIDIEPVLRDALVLALPLTPLCAPDCPGLCPTCGARLADAGPDHAHGDHDPRWAALGALITDRTPEES